MCYWFPLFLVSQCVLTVWYIIARTDLEKRGIQPKNHHKDNLKYIENIAKQNTTLIISGFYEKELKNVNQMLENFGFELLEYKIKNRWVASKYCYN